MRWCFENTSSPYAEEVLEQLLLGQQAHVPVLWLYEVVSVLAKAQRTGSITAQKAHGFLEDIRSLDITVDDESRRSLSVPAFLHDRDPHESIFAVSSDSEVPSRKPACVLERDPARAS